MSAIGLDSELVAGPGGGVDRGTTTIQGPGSDALNLSGLGLTRILRIPGSNDDDAAAQNAVTVAGLELSGSVHSSGSPPRGGAIWNTGDLTLDLVPVDGSPG